MGQKIFIEKDRYQLRGDSRDFALPVEHTKVMLDWCEQQGINVECPLDNDNQYLARNYFGVNLWRVRDDEQRVVFMLRWS